MKQFYIFFTSDANEMDVELHPSFQPPLFFFLIICRAFNVSKLSLNFDNFFILVFFFVEVRQIQKKNMGFWQNPFISDRVAGQSTRETRFRVLTLTFSCDPL